MDPKKQILKLYQKALKILAKNTSGNIQMKNFADLWEEIFSCCSKIKEKIKIFRVGVGSGANLSVICNEKFDASVSIFRRLNKNYKKYF